MVQVIVIHDQAPDFLVPVMCYFTIQRLGRATKPVVLIGAERDLPGSCSLFRVLVARASDLLVLTESWGALTEHRAWPRRDVVGPSRWLHRACHLSTVGHVTYNWLLTTFGVIPSTSRNRTRARSAMALPQRTHPTYAT